MGQCELVVRAAAENEADANPQQDEGDQDGEANLFEEISQSVHMDLIIAPEVAVEAFPHQATYNQR